MASGWYESKNGKICGKGMKAARKRLWRMDRATGARARSVMVTATYHRKSVHGVRRHGDQSLMFADVKDRIAVLAFAEYFKHMSEQ